MQKYAKVGDTVKIGVFKGKIIASDSTGRLWVTDSDGDSFIVRRRDVTEIL